MATLTLDTKGTSTGAYDGRYLKLVCEQTSKDSTKNTSTIKWTLSSEGGNSNYYSTGPTKVVINGVTVYSQARVSYSTGNFPASKGTKSGTTTISHTNDGSKQIKVELSTAVYNSTVSTVGSTWTLDPVPRYGTSVQSVNSKTETSIKMNWSSNSTVDYIWWSKDNGSNWTGINVTDGKSGTYTITGLTANTTYKIKTRIRRKDSQLTTDSSALSVTTYNYPHCTESPNFVLGDKVKLKFYNPLKRTFKFYIIGNGTQIDEDYDCSGEEYEGLTSTTTTIPYLYNTIPNARSGKYQVKVVYGSSTITRNNNNTYTIKESECYPEFAQISVKQTNATAISVVGYYLVKGISTISIEIPALVQMRAKNGATPKKYVATIGNVSKDIAYSSTDATSVDMGTITGKDVQRITVTAYDSRNLPKSVYRDVMVYDYTKPVINVSATRLNNFENQTTLKVSGSYERLIISDIEKNSLTMVQYRYRETSTETWGSWTPISATISNGKFTCNDVILDLDNSKSFEFEVRAYDSLSVSTATAKVDVGKPIFFISTNLRKLYNEDFELLTFQNMYPVGSVYCSSTNTNPSTLYGGTWELISKGFKNTIENNKSCFTASNNVVCNDCYVSRSFETVRVRPYLTINSAMNETGMLLGTFDFSKIGFYILPFSFIAQTLYSDGANGGIVYTLDSTTSTLNQLDVFNLTSISTGKIWYFDFMFTVDKEVMIDSFCDKFYWKRTA